MQIVIDIPDKVYEHILKAKSVPDVLGIDMVNTINAVKNGTPLDEVKAEIAEEIYLTDNPYTKETKYTIEHLRLLEILDHIGRKRGKECQR